MGVNQRAQITMDDDEISAFIAAGRSATLATVNPNGAPHLVAMWFAYLDGEIWLETKSRSQKAVNIRRNPLCSLLIEAGDTYDQLRGVSIDGTASIVDDPDALLRVGIDVWERYNGPYTDDLRPLVDHMLHNRVAIRVTPTRIRSWDHRKLGLGPIPLGGTTAPPARTADNST